MSSSGVMDRPVARSRDMKKLIPLIAAGAILATGAVWAFGLPGGSGPLAPAKARADLRPFDSCGALLDYVDEHRWALEPVGGPIALEDGVRMADGVAFSAAAAETTAKADLGPAVGPGQSGTNVQEAGVDEPDKAKLLGETLFVLARGGLESFDVAGDEPVALSRVELPGRRHAAYDIYGPSAEPQLLVAGERALVLSQSSRGRDWRPATTLTEIDTSDPASLELVRTMDIEGAYVSARLQGSTAHLAVSSTPDFPHGGDGREKGDPGIGATGATGAQPFEPVPGWLPRVTVTEAGGETETEPLFGCDDVGYPERFAGLGLLSVVTIDLGAGLAPANADVVMTNGQTVYASPDALYVATQSMQPPPTVADDLAKLIAPAPGSATSTSIHKFSTEDALDPAYAASGEVKGRLLSQWSMSEHDGHLRVATTEGDAWIEGEGESASAVSVLAESGDELETVGRVGGLGRGEDIYAVRFVGEVGFVITFEQTDPLYALDLSDPADPRMTGELKIPGYSAYLHPVGGELLLGIGQSGTDSGQVTGSQASLFDVGDLADPQRVDKLDLARGQWSSSAAEFDHHAFAYVPDRELALVPVQLLRRGALRRRRRGERRGGRRARGAGSLRGRQRLPQPDRADARQRRQPRHRLPAGHLDPGSRRLRTHRIRLLRIRLRMGLTFLGRSVKNSGSRFCDPCPRRPPDDRHRDDQRRARDRGRGAQRPAGRRHRQGDVGPRPDRGGRPLLREALHALAAPALVHRGLRLHRGRHASGPTRTCSPRRSASSWHSASPSSSSPRTA